METTELEHDIRAALVRRSAAVPQDVVDNVCDAHYRVSTVHSGRRLVMAMAVAALVVGGSLSATLWRSPVSSEQTSPSAKWINVVPLAYVGHAPRLEVARLPIGFRPGPDTAMPNLLGRLAANVDLPERTFHAGAGATSSDIVVAEGTDGEGPVPKILSFATSHPAATSEQTIDGDTLTMVDLASVGAGAGYLVYFPVSATTWALIGGGVGVTIDQLVTVAGGIVNAGTGD
jgi:hypothetical protein